MSLENMQSGLPELDLKTDEVFKQQSLRLLADQLKTHRYSGYPTLGNRFRGMKSILLESGRMELSVDDSWNTGQTVPRDEEREAIADMGYPTDSLGRPKHPWYRQMASDVGIGVAMGKGFFREWGPNYTADSVILQAGYVLLVLRGDVRMWATPGGFRDYDENGQLENPQQAAIREPAEEAEIDLCDGPPPINIYEGPVADIRMTANAWPETTAYLFECGDDPVLPAVRGGDDAEQAAWWPIEEARRMQLYGSHNLLIELAWRQHLASGTASLSWGGPVRL